MGVAQKVRCHQELSFCPPDTLLTTPVLLSCSTALSVATLASHLDHVLFEQLSRSLKELLLLRVTNLNPPWSHDLINSNMCK